MCSCNNLNCKFLNIADFFGRPIKYNNRNFYVCENKKYEVQSVQGELDDDIFHTMPLWWIHENEKDIQVLIYKEECIEV